MKSSRIFLPLLVLCVAALFSYGAIVNKPEPQRTPRCDTLITVEVMPLKRSAFQIWINAQGTVTPRTESTLISEVSGRITSVSPAFREGAFFKRGQELLRIDPRDYQIAVTIAENSVAQAKLALAEEQARSRQAKSSWQRMGQAGAASDLVLRKPQLASARAALASAKAQRAQARINLQRTQINAPYDDRILDQQVDVGQFVGQGTVLAKIYADDSVEIRLPLSDAQLRYVRVTETYRGQAAAVSNLPEVELYATSDLHPFPWRGRIVRTEGAYDIHSRRLSLVAQVDDPYAKRADSNPPLKIGQFVEARIKGRLLKQVFVLSDAAIRDNSQVLIVDQQSRIESRPVTIIWRDANHAVIREGLDEGEWLCLTPLPYAVNLIPVRALDEQGNPLFSGHRAVLP